MVMKAQRLYGPRDLRWMEISVPEIGDNDVLIRVKYCGVCGTDYSLYSGESSFIEAGLVDFPMTLGHEYSGVVEAVGKSVTKFIIGDRVISDTGISCGVCEQCLEGRYLLCPNVKCVGTIKAQDGGYAQYTVMPQRHVFLLPDSVSFEEGALVEPAATGLYAVKRGQVKMGDVVLILGTGPIGLGAVPFTLLSGARLIILAGRKDFKLDVGKRLGADVIINTVKEDLASRVAELTNGKGPDVIIEASGSIEMINLASKMIAPGGIISVVAFYEKPVSNLDLDLMTIKDCKIATVMGSPNMALLVLKMMEAKRIDLRPMITGIFPLEEAEKALDQLRENNDKRIKILLKA